MSKLATAPATPTALERGLGPRGATALDPSVPQAIWQRALIGPAEEFLSRPGKAVRAMIVDAGWALGGGSVGDMPERLALVIELLHAGSLIIDDIEDGSQLRRGAPALHHVIGTPLAINTGSWMYFWALAEIEQLGLPSAAELAAYRATTRTLVRCHQGQALDLATPITELAVHDIPSVVAATTRLKTGALCALAARLGALAAGASEPVNTAVAQFGEAVGCALQMLDDLGSLASPQRRTKGREDLRAARPTWPWAWLAQHDVFAWSRLIASARLVAAGDGDPDALADALIAETGALGRGHVHTAIATALDALVGVVGSSSVTRHLATELQRMESSYG